MYYPKSIVEIIEEYKAKTNDTELLTFLPHVSKATNELRAHLGLAAAELRVTDESYQTQVNLMIDTYVKTHALCFLKK